MNKICGLNKFSVCQTKTAAWGVLGGGLLLLSGCRETLVTTPPQTQQDILLGMVGFLLFLGTLVYAGYKAFVELRIFRTSNERTEYRTRSIGFVIGILITGLIIAADAAPTPSPTSQIFTLVPWYVFTCLGGLTGLIVAIASMILGRLQPTSGAGFMSLVFALISSTGMYLLIYSSGFRHSVISAIIAVMIGLLSFRMLFPSRVS
jgi:hypothetical protein